ncbi:cation efflux protein [Ramaria rubella]|nr:cation efflux protein [Ramaria rubella]
MEAHVDPRTRSKVTLNSGRVLTSSYAIRLPQYPFPYLPTDSLPLGLLTRLVLSSLFLVFVLIAGKEWILDVQVSPLWLTVRVLGCGSMGGLAWAVTGGDASMTDIEWPTLASASSLLVVQQVAVYTMLQRMSAVRALMFIQSSTLIFHTLVNPTTTRNFIICVLVVILSIFSSARFTVQEIPRSFPAHLALLLYALSTNALETMWRRMESVLGKGFAYSATTGSAFIIALLLYGLGRALIDDMPILPLSSFLPIPFIATVLLYASPHTSRIVRNIASPSYHFVLSFSSTTAFAMIFGYLAFHQQFSFSDVVIASMLIYGEELISSPTEGTGTGDNGALVEASSVSRIARAYLKTILSNPESRKIFYFLMLNLSYMGVQVVYGVITNSLGLISDAIHMAFDCMAIAMGLFASVAATWMPNEQYTYGYGRIETLSGFANGIFLILISIFIVFEAIQRLLDPPEMSTNQLLLVSTLGLGVNLFGMFAMGGHHHGGHSHSHGAHSHGNAHSHSQSVNPDSHEHDRSHDSHLHSHSHSPSPDHSPLSALHINGIDMDHIHPSSPAHIHQRTNSNVSNDHSLHIPNFDRLQTSIPDTPITPGYRFGQDTHFAEHHHLHHVPNSHDHTHHPVVHEGHSHNMRGVFLHVMADTLGSVGVIISTLLIQFYGWTGFDPIASLFIAVLIAASVIPLVIDSGRVLALDVGERDSSVQQVLNELANVEGVASYSQPRFWPKDATSVIGSIHIQLQPSVSSDGPHTSRGATYSDVERVLERVDTLLRSGIKGLEELTIQVEGMRD